ncbi:uncharacterized protein UTRI_03275_B [Ustilago trichophora]|uniref:Uncharacterized protein n=1 Tax=Ustilago trichophora TaxID=86804 RepID=A0A5C3E7G8_9BASI|nr:uncharacterized protein UTRI_03275_B [Ustilago trichophora]
MSDLITFLKAKTLEQKQVFESIRKEFRQFRNLKAELEEVRAENRTLKAKIIALQTPPLNHGGVAPPPKGVSQPTSGDGMGGGASFLQPSGPFAFHQEQPRNQHHPHARASNGQVQATAPYDHDQHRYRSSTRPSTSYSDVFAYKPPPVPFREMAPTTRGPRTPVRERFRHQPSVPLIRPPYGPTKQEAGSMQRQSSKNLPGYQRSGHSGPSGETSQRKALGSRSFPTLCRDESQLRRSDKASSWSAPNPANFDLGAGPSPRGDASAVTRPGGGVSGSQDVAMPHEQHLKAEK